MSNGFIVTGKDGSGPMGLVQLAAVKGALRLEKLGMKHSKLGKIRKPWAVKLGLKPSASYDEVIAEIERRLADIKENGEYNVEQL
jgi:hypothetical protein